MASKSKKRRRVPVQRVQAPQPRRRPARDAPTQPWPPRRIVLAALAAGLAAGALLIGLSVSSAHRSSTASRSATGTIGSVAETQILFDGVPQRRNLLGAANAPVRLVEYADLQCPFCAEFAVNVLPALVQKYVRTGQVEIEFRGIAFIGPDSLTALKTATAAGFQNRMWNVIELLYHNQGPENGWITDELLRTVVAAAGANVRQVSADRDGAAVSAAIDGWHRQSQADKVRGTPTFFYGRRGQPLQPLQVTSLTPDQFEAALDGALAG